MLACCSSCNNDPAEETVVIVAERVVLGGSQDGGPETADVQDMAPMQTAKESEEEPRPTLVVRAADFTKLY